MNLCNHIAIIPILIGLVLCVGVDTALATPSTQDVVVPLSSKNAFINKKPRVNYAPVATPNSGSAAVSGGSYQPIRTVSAGKMQSWGASALQAPVSAGTRKAISNNDATAAALTITPVAFYDQGKKKNNITTVNTTFTKRKVYILGESEEKDGTYYYDEETETWLPIPEGGPSIGDTRVNPDTGIIEVFNGTDWVPASPEPGETLPIGDIPVLLLIVLLLVYVRGRVRKSVSI